MLVFKDFVKGKRITIMGLGLLGRGEGDALFLAQCGAQVLVTDTKTEAQLAEPVARLKKYPNITFHLGGHDEKYFTEADMIIKAAGVRLDSPYIAAAKKAGVPVYMSTALAAKFAREAGATIVGITGTRGKSTVTHMIRHTLARAGRRVFLGGNVRGVSTLALVPEIHAGGTLVLELDSWQLQGFGDLKMSPDVAVVINLMPDHQNYYASMEAYFADKANIFRYQRESYVLVAGEQIARRVKAARPPAAPLVPPPLPSNWRLVIPGEHNRANASLAKAALEAIGLSESEIKEGLESFEGIEGRLQFVREIRGVKIYNDNNATTPEATIAAMRALHAGKKNIVLVMGGADKGLDMKNLLYEIAGACKRVILLAGTGTERVGAALPRLPVCESLEAAVDEAMRVAKQGDIILFSPAFASFGMFTNEYDRNDRFLALANAL